MPDLTARRTVQPQPFTADLYAPISHLIGDGSPATYVAPGLVPDWADPHDQRRMLAYRALAAIRDNARRFWLPATLWQSQPVVDPNNGLVRDAGKSPAEQYREYGDAAMLVQTARTLVLGDEQTWIVPGAAELPELEEGQEPDEDRRQAEADQQRALEVLEWLEEWSARVMLPGKLLEAEEATISEGDSVFVLGWTEGQTRPRCRVFDAGFYFPDWDSVDRRDYVAWGWDDEDFPPIVHLAWEREDADGEHTWLRRTTWQLLPAGLDSAGRATEREFPWGRSRWVCHYTVAEWRVDRIKDGTKLHQLEVGRFGGVQLVAPLELPIDFLPVVHLPNDFPGGRRFGRSLYLLIGQLLDDLFGADTDLAVSAETTASASLLTTGVSGVEPTGEPGAHFEFPTGAGASYVDTSRNLDALLKYGRYLLERLAVNARLGEALVGRVKPNEVPSGYALRLGFAPAQALMREMRLVRLAKLPLLARLAVKLGMAAGSIPAGPVPAIEIELGAALPADRAATIEEVRGLLEAGAISTVTGVRMLQAAGLPIDDAEEELDRIRAEATAQARELVEATGRVEDAYEFMGLPVPTETPDAETGGELPPGGDLLA